MNNRKSYGKLKEVLPIPDLVNIQLQSYADFLQKDISADKRRSQGLEEVFREFFPISSFDKSSILEFISYDIAKPKLSWIEAIRSGKTYGASLYATFRLENRKREEEPIEERVFLGEIPLMTDSGTFIINGVDRVVISQLHRSPGISFETTKHTSGRKLLSYRVIPDRGSWIEVQFDIHDDIYILLDRRRKRRKFLVSTFLRAIGYQKTLELLDAIYGVKSIAIEELLSIDNEELGEYFFAETVVDEQGESLLDNHGNPLAKVLDPLHEELLCLLQEQNIRSVKVVSTKEFGLYFIHSLKKDLCNDQEDALKEVYKRMRPGDPASVKNAKGLLNRILFDRKRYDLGRVGRFKINKKLGLSFDSSVRTLQKEDIVEATKFLMKLRLQQGKVDDIDHLGNRRVRTVGELIQNQVRVGLARMERLIRERMTLEDMEKDIIKPQKLVNAKPLIGVIRDFFGRGQLCQFMDQTNPLSELTNKRRLSALGPGGLSRDRAGFEVRDVHSSHYGRVCPVETPEGPNIGLIASLALYARINSYGFVETPYRKVKNKKITQEIIYLTADEEESYVIAQANSQINDEEELTENYIIARHHGDFEEILSSKVELIDISPKQLISAAAGLIPFLEHDDANRALMGSNMQRQAVPLLQSQSPYVGTGLEAVVAKDSRSVVCARDEGTVVSASANQITLKNKHSEETTYSLCKYMRSNGNTCINQTPIVRTGDQVEKDQVLADGTATENGELALGRNVTVAFLPWYGYNFEDAIIISENLVKNDAYTSIHIHEFSIIARDTKLGPEEITRDIPNVGEAALRNLGPEGIIRVGAEVRTNDILVGKITPKSETELDPEERLLRAIFGEKAADVKDSSLTVPSGVKGIVMDVEVERKVDPNHTKLTTADRDRHIKDALQTFKVQHAELIEELTEKLTTLLLGVKLTFDIVCQSDETQFIIPANRKITKVLLRKLANFHADYKMPKGPTKEQVDEVMKVYNIRINDLESRRDEIIERYESENIEDPGIVKQVKVYVASKQKISVGDKMAGRHGNKGIIARIVPAEDMPFMADGAPVEIILNPLGVPSRMNVGQVLETHLGHAVKILGMKVATPVFDGIDEDSIHALLQEAKQQCVSQRPGWRMEKNGDVYDQHNRLRQGYFVDEDGKTTLYDGRTGEAFQQRVVVGEIYMLKLDHLVVNKIHARAVGPYSLVTQQPLGGKAQHGGQRFGEMEVWALEAYGAAYTLQEMLTVKSDDVTGRTKIYESIVNGDNSLKADVPESFNVLMNEMRSLGLNVNMEKESIS